MTTSIAPLSKTFTPADQARFAELSGDWNPIHVDPVAARRTQAGTTIVHGAHSALWAIDSACRALPAGFLASRIKAKFAKPIEVGDTVELALRSDEKSARLSLTVDGLAVATITLVPGARAEIQQHVAEAQLQAAAAGHAERSSPRELGAAAMTGHSGAVSAAAAAIECANAFPAAAEAIGADAVSGLMALSRVIGMECPGLHSIFGGFSVDIVSGSDGAARPLLKYSVASWDDRFRFAALDVEGAGIKGTAEAFMRQAPVDQLSTRELLARVNENEFAEQVALIVGGSRGLGEMVAKIVAAGGGRPIVTYAVGKADAERVAADIAAAGKRCDVVRYDVREPARPQVESLPAQPTHLYFMATPHIFGRRTRLFDAAVLDEFIGYYVKAFADVCAELARGEAELRVFYPSSEAVASRPRDLTEYSMAKAAGEILCADLARFNPKMKVTVSRLPRVLTDQTAAIAKVETADPFATLLPLVRGMQE